MKRRTSSLRQLTNLLNKLYYTTGKASAYSSINRLYKEAKKINSKITLNIVKQFLSQQRTYTLHKQVNKKKPLRKIISHSINDIHSADLLDVSNISKYNDGKKFILAVVDSFSRKSYVSILKNKTAKKVLAGFKEIYRKTKYPAFLQTDLGKEFYNALLQSYFSDHNIRHYSSNSPYKASICERFIKSLKQLMYKYFTFKKRKRFIEVLPFLIKTYNDRIHSSINMAPNDVTRKNSKLVWKYQFGKNAKFKYKKSKFQINNLVRVATKKSQFSKGYEPNFSEEIFTIVDIIRHSTPLVYKIMSNDKKIIKGVFYDFQLQKVNLPQK